MRELSKRKSVRIDEGRDLHSDPSHSCKTAHVPWGDRATTQTSVLQSRASSNALASALLAFFVSTRWRQLLLLERPSGQVSLQLTNCCHRL